MCHITIAINYHRSSPAHKIRHPSIVIVEIRNRLYVSEQLVNALTTILHGWDHNYRDFI